MNLVDAQQMHRQYPESFWAPSDEDLQNIEPGDFVKVCNGQERFWVQIECVVSINNNPWDNLCFGIVDNKLLSNNGIQLGDEIEFRAACIYDIYPADITTWAEGC